MILVLAGNRSDKLLKPLGHQTQFQVLYISTGRGVFYKLKQMLSYQLKYAGDLVVIVDYPGYFSLLTLIASKVFNNKYALRIRGDIWREFDRQSYIYRIIRNFVTSYIMVSSDVILPVSKSLLRIVEEKVYTQAIVIPIAANILVADDVGKVSIDSEGKVIFVTVTNYSFLGRAEGLMEFLPIFDACRNYGLAAEWYVVGDGEYRGYLENASVEWPHSLKHIHFLGHLSNPGDIVSRASAVVYFSREDAMSNFLLEAMLLRKLLVVNEYEPLLECIKDNETGIVLETSNASESAERLMRILSQPECVEELQDSAYSWASKNYNEEAIGEKLVKVLKDL
mgnify:CR=1 FL=1